MEYKKLEKKAMYYMYLKSVISTLIVIGILSGGLWSFMNFFNGPSKLPMTIFVILIIIKIIFLMVGPFYRYQVYHYKIDTEGIDVKKGFITLTRHVVPIERLHNIEMSKGPLLRLFGLTNLSLTTAGSVIEISMITDQVAEQISESLSAKINEIVRTSQDEKEIE